MKAATEGGSMVKYLSQTTNLRALPSLQQVCFLNATGGIVTSATHGNMIVHQLIKQNMFRCVKHLACSCVQYYKQRVWHFINKSKAGKMLTTFMLAQGIGTDANHSARGWMLYIPQILGKQPTNSCCHKSWNAQKSPRKWWLDFKPKVESVWWFSSTLKNKWVKDEKKEWHVLNSLLYCGQL